MALSSKQASSTVVEIVAGLQQHGGSIRVCPLKTPEAWKESEVEATTVALLLLLLLLFAWSGTSKQQTLVGSGRISPQWCTLFDKEEEMGKKAAGM
jgi:hypothetical protein